MSAGRIPGPFGVGVGGAHVHAAGPMGVGRGWARRRSRGPLAHLDPLPYEQFRQSVLNRQIARAQSRGKTYFPPIPEQDLEVVEGRFRMRKDAARSCRNMLAAARRELAAAKQAGDARARSTTSIGICSAYRDYAYDATQWQGTFKKHYDRMIASGEYAGEEHGRRAAQHMFRTMLPLKAAPGFSNHSNGTAVDLATTYRGVELGADSDRREQWRETWLHAWLVKNAATFGFKPLASEEWHWDFQ